MHKVNQILSHKAHQPDDFDFNLSSFPWHLNISFTQLNIPTVCLFKNYL